MEFTSIRIITDDVARLVAWYERLLAADADWSTPDFAELRTERATVAIAGTRTVPLFAPGAARPRENASVILEFRVDDVDTAYRDHLASAPAGADPAVVAEPTTMPWGNRSLLLRDPDGTLVNLFAPVTAAARQRAAR